MSSTRSHCLNNCHQLVTLMDDLVSLYRRRRFHHLVVIVFAIFSGRNVIDLNSQWTQGGDTLALNCQKGLQRHCKWSLEAAVAPPIPP